MNMLNELMHNARPYLDVVSGLCLLAGMVWGVYQGAIRMIFSVVSWLLGVWVAFNYSFWSQQQLLPYVEIPIWLLAILLFVVIKVLMFVLGNLLHHALNKVGLSFSNRLMGAGLGLIQVTLILVAVWYLFNAWGLIDAWRHTYFDRFSRFVFDFLS